MPLRVFFYEIVFQFVRMCLIVSEHVFCVLIKVPVSLCISVGESVYGCW